MKILLTGSQVYGPATESSDIDIVMYYKDAKELRQELSELDIDVIENPNPNYYSFHFELSPLPPINIIAATPKDGCDLDTDGADEDTQFEGWVRATKLLKSLPPILDKEERKNTFILEKIKNW